MTCIRIACIAVLAGIAAFSIASAEASNLGDGPPCQRYAWPLDTEVALMRQPVGHVNLGVDVRWPDGVGRAIRLILQQDTDVRLIRPPERAPKRGHWYGGALIVSELPGPGLYQISLSSDAWIDVIHADRIVPSVAFTGEEGCPVRKSVRFRLGNAPITIQISDSHATELVLVLTRTSD